MQARRPFRLRAATALAAALALVGSAGRAQAPGNSASTVVRTFVYHEITASSAPVDGNGGVSPVLGASGNRAAFCVLSYDPARVAHLYLINADGTGQQEVDTYPFGGGGVTALDVSADGSKVISTHDDRIELRIASAGGGGGRPRVTLKPDTGRITAIRLSSDGSRVFFIVTGDQPQLADGTPLPAGLHVVDADGSTPPRRPIVGVHEMAALLGLPDNQYPGSLFGLDSPCLDASSTAPRRIAFASHIPPVQSGGAGQGVFAVNEDGSNLVSITGRQAFASVSISGDGTTVGYHIITADGKADVVGVVGASGGSPRELVRATAGFPTDPGFPSLFADRLQLSFDGAWFLLSSTGVLVNTKTNPPYTLQLAMRGGSYSSDPPPILYDGLFRATMNDSATRFLYLAGDRNGVRQLATLDLNPPPASRVPGLGAAPSITNASVSPPFVLTNQRSPTTISAQISASGPLDQVSYAIVLNGLHDTLFGDDVLHGDLKTGASLFSNASVRAGSTAVAGPRTVRIKAENRSGDGKRHATVVEIAPFAVLDQPLAPGSIPPIPSSPTPMPLPPGTTTGATGGTTSGGTAGGTTTGGTVGGTTTGGTAGGTTTGGTTGGTTTGGTTPAVNLTGLWTDQFDSNAKYRIRQIGSSIYWSLDDLPRVANVFQGTLAGDIITGQWVDVPGGQIDSGTGTLMLRVVSNDQLVKIGESSAYGVAPAGMVWIRVSGGATTGGTAGGTTSGGTAGGTTPGGTATGGAGGTTGGTTPGSTGGICADPRALPLMDQWLAAAIPPQQPGESLHYEAWGRVVGQSLNSTITVNGPPDTTLSRCEWLWEHADQLQSTNLGTLKDYVDKHLPIDITLSFSAGRVKGGTPVTGIVTLSRPRYGGGVGIFLDTDDDTIASVPDSVTIPAGISSGIFAITTHSVTAATSVGLYADFADLNPPVAGNPGEANLTVTP